MSVHGITDIRMAMGKAGRHVHTVAWWWGHGGGCVGGLWPSFVGNFTIMDQQSVP